MEHGSQNRTLGQASRRGELQKQAVFLAGLDGTSIAIEEGMTLHEEITQHLQADPKNVIAISTMTRHTIYKPKHLALFEAPTRASELEGPMAGVYVRQGKRRDFALAYQVRFGKMTAKKERA